GARPDLSSYLQGTLTAIQAFNLGLPIVYQQGFGDPHADFASRFVSGYVRDNFRATSKLSLNFGIRYDLEMHPEPLHRDANNWGPRVGFSFAPQRDTIVRGGYGVYYAPVFEAIGFVARVLNGRQISQVYAPLNGSPSAASVWRLALRDGILGQRTIAASDIARLGIRPGSSPPVLVSADAGLVNPYSQQFSLSVDRRFAGVNLTASYLGSRGVKLLRSRNVNLVLAGENAFGPTFTQIDPSVLQDNRVESSGS